MALSQDFVLMIYLSVCIVLMNIPSKKIEKAKNEN